MLTSDPRRRAAPPAPEPIYFAHEAALYRLQIWSEEEWSAMPSRARPRLARHVPPLGWLAGEFVTMLN